MKDLFLPNSCVWNKEKIDAILPELTPKILSIQASLEGAPDRRIWLKHTSGEYTTKMGYQAALESRAEETENRERLEFQWTKKIWEVSIPPKIKLLIWKAVHGGLPVNERLETRKIITSAACVKCGEIETIAHVFLTCPFVLETWGHVPFKDNVVLSKVNQLIEGWKAVHTGLCLPPTGVNAGSLAAWVLWTLWISRNYRIFQGKIYSAQEVVAKAIVDAKEWNTAHVKKTPPETAKRRPRVETRFEIICQSDAAWKRKAQRQKQLGNSQVQTKIVSNQTQRFLHW